jgi:hypothetical protein
MLPQSSGGPLKWPERGCYDPGDTIVWQELEQQEHVLIDNKKDQNYSTRDSHVVTHHSYGKPYVHGVQKGIHNLESTTCTQHNKIRAALHVRAL